MHYSDDPRALPISEPPITIPPDQFCSENGRRQSRSPHDYQDGRFGVHQTDRNELAPSAGTFGLLRVQVGILPELNTVLVETEESEEGVLC